MSQEQKFIIPLLEVIEFNNDDIIFTSGETDVNGCEIDQLE